MGVGIASEVVPNPAGTSPGTTPAPGPSPTTATTATTTTAATTTATTTTTSSSSISTPSSASSRRILLDLVSDCLKLARERLSALCVRLPAESFLGRLPPGHTVEGQLDAAVVAEQAWRLMHVILHRHTHLMYHRHLDQILLCALYGVCKAHGMELMTFKRIVHVYQLSKAEASPLVYKSVPYAIGCGLEVTQRTDIIRFYNDIFLPTVKPDLLACPRQYLHVAEHLVDSEHLDLQYLQSHLHLHRSPHITTTPISTISTTTNTTTTTIHPDLSSSFFSLTAHMC